MELEDRNRTKQAAIQAEGCSEDETMAEAIMTAMGLVMPSPKKLGTLVELFSDKIDLSTEEERALSGLLMRAIGLDEQDLPLFKDLEAEEWPDELRVKKHQTTIINRRQSNVSPFIQETLDEQKYAMLHLLTQGYQKETSLNPSILEDLMSISPWLTEPSKTDTKGNLSSSLLFDLNNIVDDVGGGSQSSRQVR